MSDTREKYGLRWPAAMHDAQIELYMWKHWRELPAHAKLKNPVEEHLYDACSILFTPGQLVRHKWFEIQAHSWTYDTFALWWGCAGSGKSHSLGLFTLLDFITDPDCTFCLLASTSKEMLATRSYASVVQYLSYLKTNRKFTVPFKFVASSMTVVPEGLGDDEIVNLKHKIMGVAVQQGTTQEARQKLQGVHTTYVRAVFDELAGMRPAAMASRANLSQCFDFKLMAASNPESRTDQCGLFSVPVKGWSSIDLGSREWETPYGKCYRFDAYESQGLTEPAKYPFLPGKKFIAESLKSCNGNEDAPDFMTFVRAFVPSVGEERTILTEAMVQRYLMMETVMFRDDITKIAALDPAFTSDGDDCTLVTAKVGYSAAGTMTIAYDKVRFLSISGQRGAKPVTEQIVDQVVQILADEGIPVTYLAVDDSGTQSIADAIAMRTGVAPMRFNYSNRPPDIPVSVSNPTLASEKYRNMVTWLYFSIAEFAERGQIRGLPLAAAEELCRRRVKEKLRPLSLESKADHKKRTHGKSPDTADCCAMIAGVARLKLGVSPGGREWAPMGDKAIFTGLDRGVADRYNNLESSYSGVDTGGTFIV